MRCFFNKRTVTSSSLIVRKLAFDFGVDKYGVEFVGYTRVLFTVSVLFSRSISSHVKANASPIRNPVRAKSVNIESNVDTSRVFAASLLLLKISPTALL